MVTRLCVSALFTSTLLAVAPPLQAQSVGDRLRVFVADSTFVGSVTAVSDEGFELVQGRILRSFNYAAINQLELSVGTRRLWKEGFVTGLKVPLYVGGALIVGCFSALGEVGDSNGAVLLGILCILATPTIVAVAITAAPIGAVVGAGIGAFMHGDVWAPVPIDGVTGFSSVVAPRFGPERRVGLELGVSFRIW